MDEVDGGTTQPGMSGPFGAAAAERLRAALAPMQTPGAYEPGRWWVPAHSRSPEVLADAPSSVAIRDITMRTIEQMAGIAMPKADRHRLLRAIVATGVPEVMSTSTYLGTRGDDEIREDIELIRETNPDCRIVFTAVRSAAEAESAAAGGFDRASVTGNFIGDAAPLLDPRLYQRLWRGEGIDDLTGGPSAQQMIDRAAELVAMTHAHGLPVGATINLIAKQSDDYIAAFAGAVVAAGADEVVFADGSSSMSPEAFAHAVRVAKAAAPTARIAVHTHDFLGLGLACALASVLAGAEVVEVAVNGYHLAYGQADLAPTAVALESLYGISTGVDLAQLTPLSRLAEELVGLEVAAYHPVVGHEIFALGWLDPMVEENFVEPLLHKPITPDLVGGSYRVLPTVSLGPFGMKRLLDELGVEATREEIDAVLVDCLGVIERENRRVTEDDVRSALARARDASDMLTSK